MYTNTHSQTGGGKWLWITIGSIVLLLAIASFIERQNLKDWYNNHFNKPKEASISAYNIKVTDPLKAPPAEPNKPTWDQLGIGYEYIAADGDKISLQSSQAGISDPKDRSNLWSFLDWADKSIAIRNNSLDKFLTKDLNLSTDINSSKWILKQIDSAKKSTNKKIT
ncbi:hypothetical protein CPAV1605_1578 [seawater metagenome]|uniref:Uncharacterized protein n=1 Tax=seawater metagenome TaxID=1561972 RepID=A0A5E8CKR9_9ZZZZ